MVVYEHPWPHIVIEDYYSPEVFSVIKKESKKYLSNNVNAETRKQAFSFPENDALKECIATRPLDESCFDVLTNHRPYNELRLFWEVNFLMGPLSYPIHDESSRKVLSCVVYVDPEANTGTTLYNADKSFAKSIPWKPNTALIFAAIDGVTWHDYSCPKGKFRVTINQFLERPRSDE